MRELASASSPSAPVSGIYRPLALFHRILLLALLFGAELTVLTVWLDGASLAGRTGLTGAIRDEGPWILRCIVGFAALFITVSYLTHKAALERISARVAGMPVRWSLLGGHASSMAVLAVLSAGLYGHQFPAFPRDFIAVLWLSAGIVAIACAGLAFLPRASWNDLTSQTNYSWAYASGAVLFASSAENLSRSLWPAATRLTFGLVKLILQPFLTVILADPVRMFIQTPHFRVRIAPECSGLEGAGLMLAFGVTLLWLFREECRFPQCLVLIPAGIVLLFLLNAVRIAVLVWIGDAGAREIAAGGFHSQAGWLAFNAVALGFAVIARRLPWFSTKPADARDVSEPTHNPAATFLLPFLAILAAGMVVRAASAGFEWLYPIRFLAAAIPLWLFRRSYAELNWKSGWLAAGAGALVFALWIALDRLVNPGGAAGMPSALAASPASVRIAWLGFRVLAAVVTVPIAEELAFRGFLLRRLVSADFESVPWQGVRWFPLLASSVAFGVLHGGHWIAGTAAGVVFGLVQARRGRIGDAVLAHGTSNALLAVYVLGFGQWQVW